jgi:hypothetical protein
VAAGVLHLLSASAGRIRIGRYLRVKCGIGMRALPQDWILNVGGQRSGGSVSPTDLIGEPGCRRSLEIPAPVDADAGSMLSLFPVCLGTE